MTKLSNNDIVEIYEAGKLLVETKMEIKGKGFSYKKAELIYDIAQREESMELNHFNQRQLDIIYETYDKGFNYFLLNDTRFTDKAMRQILLCLEQRVPLTVIENTFDDNELRKKRLKYLEQKRESKGKKKG